MNYIDILNEYMSNIIVEINNIKNMSFNSKVNLKNIENILNNIYNKIGKRIKMLNGFPLTNMLKIEEISQIKSMQSREYNNTQVNEVLLNDFNYLKDYTSDLISLFSKENDIYTSHMLLEFLIVFEDEILNIKNELL